MAKASFKPTIGDEAVQARTGKGWAEWFAILDKCGARKMGHKEIVACLDEYDIGGWWQQLVTVTYEQARGLRDKHQKTDGYSASASKSIAVPVKQLFEAWHDEKQRKRWLKGKLTIRKATPNKSLRLTWGDDSNVEVNLYPKGQAKSQVAVEHNKLASAADVERMKEHWAMALERLKELLTAD